MTHTQWIDALEFRDYGGFSAETQFVQEVGQGYLLALEEPGVPVAPASTAFRIDEPGMYRIWVRCKNWLREASPGRLKVLVDGRYLPNELGMLPSEQWGWQAPGDAWLEDGEHTLTVEDTTGYFSRFAAVVITDDMDYTPDPQKERLWKERAVLRGEPLEPQEAGTFDVVVAGGGPAGVPAAIIAARKGLKVALVHSRPALGGNSSDEGAVSYGGAFAHFPYIRETGIVEEMRRIRDYEGVTWEKALTKLARAEKNLTVFYNQLVIDAEARCVAEYGGSPEVQGASGSAGTTSFPDAARHIESVVAIDCMTGLFYRYRGTFYIDCTGDGWVGYYAGAKYRLGREAQWQYSEPLAPEAPDNQTMSGTLMGMKNGRQIIGYYAEQTDKPVPYSAPAWAVRLPEGDDLHRDPIRLTTGDWWLENPTDIDDLWEQEKTRDELLRLNLGYFHWLKNTCSKRELARNLRLKTFGRFNARRENRRLVGDYVLTENDCRQGRTFPDSVSYCGWALDIHHPRGLFSGKDGPFFSCVSIPVTEIPYRCLYSKNVDNLLMAGRCVSVSHIALGSVRVQNTLANLGQAAGTAAYIAIEHGTTPRGVYEEYLNELRQTLLRDDLYIPSLPNSDENDIALRARVSATSFSTTERFVTRRGVPGGYLPLDRRRVASCPVPEKIEFVRIRLKNENPHPVKVHASLTSMGKPDEYETMSVVEEAEITLPASFEDEVEVPFTKYPSEGALGVVLEPCEGVGWREILFACDDFHRGEPLDAYHWKKEYPFSLALRLADEELPLANCRPEMVVNGYSRIVSPSAYEWVSDPACSLPQSLTLSWPEGHDLGTVQVVFDTDLTNPAYGGLRYPTPSQLVRNYFVQVCTPQGWKTVLTQEDNFQRRCVLQVDEENVTAVRITVTATWGGPSACLTEIRVYEKADGNRPSGSGQQSWQ